MSALTENPSPPVDGGAVTGGTSYSRLGLATVSVVLFLTFLDNTVVSVVLGNVQADLHGGVAALQWVVNGYALVFAGFMLPLGAVADLFGRKKVMVAGVALFCAGSVLGALAPNLDVLIASRVIMGLGAAASEPGTLSMIRHLYPDRRVRARALGVWAAVSGLALAMGPVVGGVLVGVWSWRAIFWFNVAFGLVALLSAAKVLPESSDPGSKKLDYAGFLLGAGSIAAATFAVICGETAGYRTAWIDALFVVAAVGVVTFLLVERRAQNPMLDTCYLKVKAFDGSNFVAFATYFGVFSIFFFVALYLQIVGNRSGYSIAELFAPMAAGLVVASVFAGRWVAVSGPRMPMFFGCVLGGAGILLTDAFLTPQAGIGRIGWTLAITGIGFGTAIVPVTSTALSVVPPEHSGMAASATNTSRELGAVAGVAILGSVVNGQLTANLTHRLTAIGIPKSFIPTIITDVETGTVGKQAAAFGSASQAINEIIQKVLQAVYGAFKHGLDLSLISAGVILLISAVVVFFCIPDRHANDPAACLDHPENKGNSQSTDV
jgi:EmrB/QacA subfamily drug resistance transporter